MNDSKDLRIDDQWILQCRGDKNRVDPFKPYEFLIEKERTLSGLLEDTITIFLTNMECRFNCLMCDLWKNTTDRPVPAGAIPSQIEHALGQLPGAKHLKLYNSANFFDPGAIPYADYQQIADLVEPFDTLIVENHPLLTGERCIQFAEMIRPRLQVAMGLETVHPEVLSRLNKRMSLEDFRRAADLLNIHGISSRAFILLRPPFMSESEGIHWAKKSLDFAFDSGIKCCTVIPTREGNGAMDKLKEKGLFFQPDIKSLEEVLEYGIQLGAGPVFADLWDINIFSSCSSCFAERKSRLEYMNLNQQLIPPVRCSCDQ